MKKTQSKSLAYVVPKGSVVMAHSRSRGKQGIANPKWVAHHG